MPDHGRLAADRNFLSLFEEGPLADHIRSLRDRVLSTITDPATTVVLRAELNGIESVRRIVLREAHAEESVRLRASLPTPGPRKATMLPKAVP